MKTFLYIFVSLVLARNGFSQAGRTLDLAGEWRLALDAGDLGLAAGPSSWSFNDTIALPNTLTLAGKGEALAKEPQLDKATMANLHQRFFHLGPAWFQREFTVPEAWAGMDVQFEIERVLWESRVWINGREAGIRDSLCAPHRYEVGDLIQPGKNTLTLRIDNREKFPIGIGHAYTNATQTIWNGAIGRIQLSARPKVRLESMRLRPLPGGKLSVVLESFNGSGATVTENCRVIVSRPDGTELDPVTLEMKLAPGSGRQELSIDLGPNPVEWCEFDPLKYKVRAVMESAAGNSEIMDGFGYRIFKAKGRSLHINGRPVFLRGTLECCIFPKTGHPDMTGREWEKIFSTVKSYGLNHVRFHSWCPPKVAFELADRHGIYLQVELPNWSFEMGRRPPVDDFFRREGERIFREYGNHPSFVMFSLGNELDGELGAMDGLLKHLREDDPDKLFTSTSFAFSPRGKTPGPEDDFFISQETASGWVRGQGFLNQTPPNTDSDYAAGLSSIKMPLVTHEVGQYNNYPNLAELPKYDGGALRQLGYEAIRNDLAKKGRLEDAPRLTQDSGKLAVLLYKEDMERALRTKDLAGIQLLDLHDFPGQSTATIGVLDAFWDSKGLVTAEEFSEFSAPTVPLVRMKKMAWQNTEQMVADVEIAHFGKLPMKDASLDWKLAREDGSSLDSGAFHVPEIPLGNGIRIGRIVTSLSEVPSASRLNLTVSIRGTRYKNRWPVWVYPSKPADNGGRVLILDSPGPELSKALANGRSVLLLPPRAALQAPIDARFIPVFWSPLHFPNQPGTLGASIDDRHPVFRNFPTDTFTNWQWWELFSTSHAMDLNDLKPKPSMPLTFVDKFDRNALPAAIWESRCGPGKLLVCTLDITTDLNQRIVARQLRQSILSYMNSDQFSPRSELVPDRLSSLFRSVRFIVGAKDRNPSHPPEFAVDGDGGSFWHTDWSAGGDHLPARFTVDLGKEMVIRGFRYTPRQDMNRGRIESYLIEVGSDGKKWHAIGGERRFDDVATAQLIAFEKPVKARYLGFNVLSDHGRAGHAAIAEIEPLTVDSPDVRELGIIPGFND
jgi:hypothetical protein